jgi:isoquinoline 1-oxidoreductase subunit alpha
VSNHSFILNGKPVSVDCPDNVHMLWVVRDLLGVHGPKYGCGLGVCQACTSHVNGQAVNLCSVLVSDIKSSDEITTIEGLPGSVGMQLHPMQQSWLDHDVAQCGYCQPGQIMSAVALVQELHAQGKPVDDAALDTMRNVCRCGTYFRIRNAVKAGAAATIAATPVIHGKSHLIVRYFGRHKSVHGILLEMNTSSGSMRGVKVDLRRKGRSIAHTKVALVNTHHRKVVLRPPAGHSLGKGNATLLVSRAGSTLVRRPVHVG